MRRRMRWSRSSSSSFECLSLFIFIDFWLIRREWKWSLLGSRTRGNVLHDFPTLQFALVYIFMGKICRNHWNLLSKLFIGLWARSKLLREETNSDDWLLNGLASLEILKWAFVMHKSNRQSISTRINPRSVARETADIREILSFTSLQVNR